MSRIDALKLRLILMLTPKGWAIVPRDPTHSMERAYFTAPMPEFRVTASSATRRKNNKKKMESRWTAMVDAGIEVARRKAKGKQL